MSDMSHLAAQVTRVVGEHRANFGTMVLDAKGYVVSCSDAGLRMFGGHHCAIEGSSIWRLITNGRRSEHSGVSPTYGARYLAHLSRAGDWQKFQAVDVYGEAFPVEVIMSKMKVEQDDIFLLNFRHPVNA